MADIIREIRDLNGEIASLKENIQKYDKEISNASATSAKVERMFAVFKNADASTMATKDLAKATKDLAKCYEELKGAKSAYEEREKATLSTIQKLTEQNKLLAAAQRQALSNGDQQGAGEIYRQYLANSQAMQQYGAELSNTRDALQQLEIQTNSVAKVSDRFALVQEAAKKANSTTDIGALIQMYEDERKEITSINLEIQDYAKKYRETSAIIKSGNLTPEQLDKKIVQLEQYKNKLNELSDAYAIASQRANIFAQAAGKSSSSIPQMASLPKQLQPNNVEFPKLKELSKDLNIASIGMDDVLKKGVLIGGLSFGAKQMADFGRQVMSVRSEFQQLEVAFTTLLGSEQKSNALMQQLTKTAATTPFDLQSVSRGAKQLLAYGTAAEDVNDILVHLGDIAAGLSQPLDALVYLYGTTMVQGKMMTMDLRQFQNRGIPIAEELAKQFGVAKSEVQGLVSSGRVTAEEFHKAIMAMSSDGGKFAGLMAAQSKTIGGQISNIEDNISMMFNEIGKKSEGIINAGLNAVSTLVENYEEVGKTILSLIAIYGTYRAALIVVNALEKARVATTLYNLVSGQKAISMTKMLTVATWKQVKAQLASNAAMLASPAFWITTAIVGLVAGTIAMTRALDSERKAQEKLNKAKKEQQSFIENTKSQSDAAITTLQNETATAYEKAKAYETLKNILPQLTSNYSQTEIASMSLEQAQKLQAQALEELKFEEKRKEIENYRLEIERLEKIQSEDTNAIGNKVDAMGQPVFDYGLVLNQAQIDANKKAMEQAQKEFAQMQAEHKKAKEKEEFEKLPIAQQIEKLKVEERELQQQFDSLEFKAIEGIINPIELALLEQLKDKLRDVKTQITALEKAPDDLGALTRQILKAEKEVDVARKAYSANMSEGNKTDLETAEANLKTKTELYQKATGQQWTATKEFNKQNEQESRSAARKQEDILTQEFSKRYQLALKYQRDLEDLELEKKEWEEKNVGRVLPSYFAEREDVINEQFKFDTEKLDKELNEWLDDVQRETRNILNDKYVNELEAQLEIADDYNERLKIRNKLREQEIRQIKEEGDLQKEQELRQKFNDKTYELYTKLQEEGADRDAILSEYSTKYGIDITILEGVLADMKRAADILDTQTASRISTRKEEHKNEDLTGVYSEYYALGEGLTNYAAYERKKKEISDKYNELISKARQAEDAETAEKMVKAFTAARDKELKELNNNFFLSLTTPNADGSQMSIAERLLGKNGNVKLLEATKLLKNLKKAKDEFQKKGKISEDTMSSLTGLTNLTPDNINKIVEDTEQVEEAWRGVKETIAQGVAELGNIDSGNQNVNKMLFGIAQAADLAMDKTATLTDKLNGSVSIITNTLGGAFTMIANTLGRISDATGDTDIAETAEVLSGVAQNISAAGAGAASGGWIGAIVGGVTDALGQIFNAVMQNVEAATEAENTYQKWADSATQIYYKSLLSTKKGIFGNEGVEEFRDAVKTLNETKGDYDKTLVELYEASQVNTERLKSLLEEKNKLGWEVGVSSVLTGGVTLLNAQVWKDLKAINQELDTYKDSLIEVLVGGFYKGGQQNIDAFVSKVKEGYTALEALQVKTLDKTGTKKDEFAALKDLAPEIFKEDGSLNTDALDAFMQAYGDKLTEEQRMLLERLKTQQDAYNEAFEQASEFYTSIFSSVGSSLMDSFEAEMLRGEDALDSFTDTVGDAVEEWVRQFAYMAYIQPILQEATEMVENAIKKNGVTTEDINAAMDEALALIYNNFDTMQSGYTSFLENAQSKYGEMFGMDLFQDIDAEGSKGFGQMTQDQADTLTARFTAVQIEMANVSATTQAMAGVVSLVGEDIKLGVAGIQSLLYNSNIALQMAQDQLDHLQVIADNTAMLTETNNRLRAIEQNTGRL